jgi:nucleoside-diphosphate-sugar epimerase
MDSETQDLRISNNKLLIEYVQQSDFVFFLAFDVGGAKYLSRYQDTYNFIQNNILIMANTFEILRKNGSKFMFASSQMAEMSRSSYGLCKVLGEKYTEALGGINIRLWNVYGDEKASEKSHALTDFIVKARDEGVIKMLTDGSEERQFLHADDCCECMLLLSDKYDLLDRQQNYHISSFEWVSIGGLASKVAENFKDVKVVASTATDTVHAGHRVEPSDYILNYWQPKISLDRGVRDIILKMGELINV